jgi:flagellar basal body rod protein FlgB
LKAPLPKANLNDQGLGMNLLSLTTDNVTELLTKIMEFTEIRQKILAQNINNMHTDGFVPKDLAIQEFSELLNTAIEEHVRSRRLLLCDTQNIKFGVTGDLEISPVVDERARELLQNNRDRFLELQIDKLLENSINQRVAAELLRQREAPV